MDERGVQVSIMNQVYRQADRVFTWLGEAFPDPDIGIDAIDRLRGDREAH